MVNLFVYGSLKTDGPLTLAGRSDSVLISRASLRGYSMRNCGAYPAAIREHGSIVHGELWRVSAACLADCDDIEGYPYHYDRALVAVHTAMRVYTAWVYYYRAGGHLPRVDSGAWPIETRRNGRQYHGR